MLRQRVSSSNLHSVGYDVSSGVLEIEFVGGGVYQDTGVPESIYTGLMLAGSKGSYFYSRIRDRYPTHKVV